MDLQAIKTRRYAPVAIPDDLFELQGNTIYLHPELRGVSCRQAEEGQWYIVFMGSSNIAKFIAHAPADIAALIERVEELEAALNEVIHHVDTLTGSKVRVMKIARDALKGGE